MLYYELTINCILKKDLGFKESLEELSKVINKTFLLDKNLKKLHKMNTFKMYSFDDLYPVTREGYKKGNSYGFHIKTIDRVFALKMENLLKKTNNDLIDITDVNIKLLNTGKIKELYTVTPVISVIRNGRHWTKNDYPLDLLIERINKNAAEKYNYWFNSNDEIEPDYNFIEDIKQINDKVIVLTYKKGIFLTNKFKLKVKEDDISQKLAEIVFICGLLEKNSLGMGYCTIAK